MMKKVPRKRKRLSSWNCSILPMTSSFSFKWQTIVAVPSSTIDMIRRAFREAYIVPRSWKWLALGVRERSVPAISHRLSVHWVLQASATPAKMIDSCIIPITDE